jgi:F-type H+-transporting ATPase subunit a
MDLFPVDILPAVAGMMGMEYMRVVPSTDLNATFALSISVFCVSMFVLSLLVQFVLLNL